MGAPSRVSGNRLRLGSWENLVMLSLWILLDHWHGISIDPTSPTGQAPTVQVRDQNSRPTYLLTISKYKMHFERRGTSHSMERIWIWSKSIQGTIYGTSWLQVPYDFHSTGLISTPSWKVNLITCSIAHSLGRCIHPILPLHQVNPSHLFCCTSKICSALPWDKNFYLDLKLSEFLCTVFLLHITSFFPTLTEYVLQPQS
jgi:hypothetical protein